LDLLALDERLEKDMKHLEHSLVEYEKLMSQASALKYTFENQTKELMATYEEKIEQLNAKFMRDEESSLKKEDFELYVNQMTEADEKKWKAIQIQNENDRSDLEGRVSEKISKLEAEGISDELYKLLGKNRAIDVSIEAINTDMCKLKSDSEKSLINLSAELFKETMRAEDKDRKLAKNFKLFMAISSVLFMILLIWR
jgi:hypothetical protein